MNLSHPIVRSLLVTTLFFVLLVQILSAWVMERFVHLDAQNRLLAPQHYDVQVLTADEFHLLSDPTQRSVTLSDGTTIIKAPIWDTVVLTAYKPTPDNSHYVLVTTKGSAHALPYLEPIVIMSTLLTCFGLLLSLWNLSHLHRELRPAPALPTPRRTQTSPNSPLES